MNTPTDNQTGLVTVFATADLGVVAFVKSLLDGAEITYLAKGDDLFNMAAPGARAPQVEFQVSSDDEQVARELLSELNEPCNDAV